MPALKGNHPGHENLGLLLFVAILAGACTTPGQIGINTPQQQPASYPPLIEDTPARKQAAQQAWTQFLTERWLPEANPDMMPITNTPRTLPTELSGRININAKPGKPGDTELKEALRQFIELSRGILSGEGKNSFLNLKDLSLVSFSNDGNFHRAVYRQVNYPFSIAEGYGELHLTVDKNGGLLQWSSTLLPNIPLPVRAEIKPESLKEKILGREFTYTTFAGRPQSYRVTKAEEIKAGELVIYPKVIGSRMELHIAYAVVVGQGMTWTVYVDAINGNELGVKQNFAT
ncbi:MAG: hypothetical protein M3X11_12140 [Acidobacteriota bacterium]|nr:hypothetical protein [Acidobacteriota bacterium]